MSTSEPKTSTVVAAFLAVYLIWGSTYLGIRWVVETMPPFLSAGVRHLLAGGVLYAFLRLRGEAAPDKATWKAAGVVGVLLLFGGNGLVSWAEQLVPSGLTALIIAIIPVEIVLLAWLWPGGGGKRPRKTVFGGLALGAVALAVLVGPSALLGAGRVDPLGALVLVAATAFWATGSVYQKNNPTKASPFMATAVGSFTGGVACLAFGSLMGEWSGFDVAAVSARSWWAFAYLVVFGSVVAFTCYVWLLKVSTPARVSTYAYVNPLVAVVLGWLFAGEPLGLRTFLAGALILAAVAMVLTDGRKASAPPPRREAASTP